jgi:glycosyltransferase involved in cell wall biosynthesis
LNEAEQRSLEKSEPTISVVMPVHNDEQYVAEAIESILNQTFGDFELIIVDDGSTDNSPEVIDSYAAKDGRIRVIRNPKATGPAAARNRGIETARGRSVGVSGL